MSGRAGRVRGAVRRLGPLGWLAAASAPLLAGWPVYVWGATFRPLLAGDTGYANDYLFYHAAGVRFLSDPATLYADPSFMYPPPSVLLFAPLGFVPIAAGYVVLGLATLLATGAVVALFVCLAERATGQRLGGAARAALAVAAFTAAPVWQTVKMGQVAVVVLALALGAVAWMERRPLAAGLVLAGGFWLKVYPLALAPLGLRERRRGRMALGLALGLVALPAVLLPLVPAALYADHAALMGRYSGLTNPGALNEGLPAVLMRLGSGAEAFGFYGDRPLAPLARVVSAGATLLLGGLLVGAYLRGRLRPEPAAFGLLAAVAAVSAYGWEFTYVMALPLLWWTLLRARSAPPLARVAALAAAVVFLTPKPPETLVAWTLDALPRPIPDLLYARYLLVTLGLLVALLAEAWRPRSFGHEGAEAGAAPNPAGAPA